jgi:hypothetical protein
MAGAKAVGGASIDARAGSGILAILLCSDRGRRGFLRLFGWCGPGGAWFGHILPGLVHLNPSMLGMIELKLASGFATIYSVLIPGKREQPIINHGDCPAGHSGRGYWRASCSHAGDAS